MKHPSDSHFGPENYWQHPVLHVKKGAEIYDDANPDGMQSIVERARERARRPVEEGPAPAVRRGRMVFFPLLFLALALLAVFHFAPRMQRNRATMAGWQVILRATPLDARLVVGVTFIAPTSGGPVGVPFARARIALPDTGETLVLAGPLVKSPMTLRGELPYTAAVKRVVADVSVGEKSARLTLTARAAR